MNARKIFMAVLCLTLMPGVSLATDLVDNLISVWKLDEANSDALDAHGLNKLTQGGTVGTATGKVYATARSFERASAERFSIPDNATLSGGSGISFTMGAWVKLASDPAAGQYFLIVAKDDGSTNREYYLGCHGATGNDKFAFQTWNATSAGGPVLVETDAVVTTGTWYFVQAGFDATTEKIWIRLNDSAPVTATQTVIFDSNTDFRIGSNSNSTPAHGWNGEIGPVVFYKRYVSGGELRQHYNSNLGLVYDGYGVNVSHWLAKAAATPTVPGVPEIDVTHITGQTATVATTPIDANVTKFGGGTGVFSNGRPEVNTTHFGGSALTQSGGRPEVNTTHISGDLSGADRAEALFDLIVRDTIVSLNGQTGFSLQQGNQTNDSYKGWLAVFTEGVNQSVRTIMGNNYDDPVFAYVIDSAPDFMISTSTVVTLLPPTFAAADRTSLSAIKTKTDFLPSATAGNSGGLAILDANLNVQADLEAVDDDTSAPANAESYFDGTGFGVHPFRATIASISSQTVFYMGTGPETDGSLVDLTIIFRDATAGEDGGPALSRRTITAYDYEGTVRTVTINSAPDFTIGAGDTVEILPP